MPRSTRPRASSVLELTPPRPESSRAPESGVDRLRDVLRSRRAAPAPARPSFRDRLEAWLEEEL